MAPRSSAGFDEVDGAGSTLRTDRLPIAPGGSPARPSGTVRPRARTIAVLPAPPTSDPPPAEAARGGRLRWPELGRSTMLLLVLLAAVVLVAGGAFLGRLTAPATVGPPVVTGSVESVSGDSDSSQLTVRTPDGTLVVFAATTATVGASRPGGLSALRPGQQVVVDPEIDQRGSLAATTVLVQAAP